MEGLASTHPCKPGKTKNGHAVFGAEGVGAIPPSATPTLTECPLLFTQVIHRSKAYMGNDCIIILYE
jgi:hypothetical protein